MWTPHPPHPSTEEVLGYRWLLGFVQIGPILTARDAITAAVESAGDVKRLGDFLA